MKYWVWAALLAIKTFLMKAWGLNSSSLFITRPWKFGPFDVLICCKAWIEQADDVCFECGDQEPHPWAVGIHSWTCIWAKLSLVNLGFFRWYMYRSECGHFSVLYTETDFCLVCPSCSSILLQVTCVVSCKIMCRSTNCHHICYFVRFPLVVLFQTALVPLRGRDV